MDFIERWFHISPDGGNGSLEFLIAASIVVVVISISFAMRQKLTRLFRRYRKQLRKEEDGNGFES